jgi:hypothetical protein
LFMPLWYFAAKLSQNRVCGAAKAAKKLPRARSHFH